MNPQRISGLQFNLTTSSAAIETLDYQHRLEQAQERYPDFKDRLVLGDGIYTVFDNSERRVPIDGSDGQTIQLGNLYVYEGPTEGAERHATHFVDCWNEPKNLAENEDYSCRIRLDWHGLTPRTNVWAGGQIFTPMEHEHFPALADDLLLLLEEVDVTDNPERQDCIRSGDEWRDGQCQDISVTNEAAN